MNDQITDAVSQVNTTVISETPATAMGNLLTSTSQALSNAAHNATNNQQQASITWQAATVQGINSLLSAGSAASRRSARSINRKV